MSRQNKQWGGDECSKCDAPRASGGRYCRIHANEANRKWREKTPLTAEQKLKDNCRSYAGVYKRRGKIIQGPCIDCGSEKSEMHHEDYTKPLEVLWLCRKCHMTRHGVWAK